MASQKNIAHTQSQTHLLDKLPAELRNTIWEYALTLDEPGEEGNFFPIKRLPTKTLQSASSLSLLHANKQIHNEAQGIFLRLQHPHFANTRDLKRFIRTIGPKRLEGLSKIAVDANGAEGLTAVLRSLSLAKANLPNLESLTIHLASWYSHAYLHYLTGELERGCHGTFVSEGTVEQAIWASLLPKLPKSLATIRILLIEKLNATAGDHQSVCEVERRLMRGFSKCREREEWSKFLRRGGGKKWIWEK